MKLRESFIFALTLCMSACSQQADSTGSRAVADDSLARVQAAGVLRWGADVVGGEPYVFEDSKNPGQYKGFEWEIATALAQRLGVKLELTVKAWDTLIPELQRGSFDMAMNGIEDTPERAKIVLFSEPYYIYSQQLTVRRETNGVATLQDLVGKRVATLSGTAAEDILHDFAGVEAVIHPEIIYSYRDLEEGKVDAVLLDKPIAVAYGASNPALKNVGESFSEGRYVIVFRNEDISLRNAINAELQTMMKNGELKAIYERFGLMDEHEKRLGIQ
jgi:polar amino acid transport system substrate-binding protein